MKLEECSVRFTPKGSNGERFTWMYDSYDELMQDVKDDYALDFFSERKKENAKRYGIGFDKLNNINKYYAEFKIDNSHIIKKQSERLTANSIIDYIFNNQIESIFKAYSANSKFEKSNRAFAFYYTLISDYGSLSKENAQRMADKRNLDISDFLENSQDKLLTWAMGTKDEMTIYYLDKEKAFRWI